MTQPTLSNLEVTPQSPHKPKVIFLDAVGTLFGVSGGVGQAYSDVAKTFGVEIDPETLSRSFAESWAVAPPLAFPAVDEGDRHRREFQWWGNLALQTFSKAGGVQQFQDFPAFFSYLYDYFATAEPWFLYDDTLAALEYWRGQGIELGVISNFDSRAHCVLEALGLTDYFRSVTLSTEVGQAKPHPQIFLAALEKHHCSGREAWHVGDSPQEDYEGARGAGLHGILLQRSPAHAQPSPPA